MKQAHIECMKRLCTLTGCYDDMVNFLLEDKVITKEALVELNLEHDKVRQLCHILFDASKTEKIQLLAFDWVVLPVERISLKIVTDMGTKEYTHNF